MYMFFFVNLEFFCKAASNVGPYWLFWQPALVCYSSILYLCLLIGQIKMLAAYYSPGVTSRKRQSEMEKYCPQQGQPERGDVVFVAEVLSQVKVKQKLFGQNIHHKWMLKDPHGFSTYAFICKSK